MEFYRQEYWPFPSPGDLLDPGIEPRYLHCRQILHRLSHQEAQVTGVMIAEQASAADVVSDRATHTTNIQRYRVTREDRTH